MRTMMYCLYKTLIEFGAHSNERGVFASAKVSAPDTVSVGILRAGTLAMMAALTAANGDSPGFYASSARAGIDRTSPSGPSRDRGRV